MNSLEEITRKFPFPFLCLLSFPSDSNPRHLPAVLRGAGISTLLLLLYTPWKQPRRREEERTIVVTTCTPIQRERLFRGCNYIHEARNCQPTLAHARTHAHAFSSGKGLCPMICSGTIMPQLPDTLTHPPLPLTIPPLQGKLEPIPPPLLRPATRNDVVVSFFLSFPLKRN